MCKRIEDLNIATYNTELLFKWGSLNDVVSKKRNGRVSYVSMTEYMLLIMKMAFECERVTSFLSHIARRLPPSVIKLNLISRAKKGRDNIFMIELHLFRGRAKVTSIVAYNENIAIKLITEFIYKELCAENDYDYKTIYDLYSRMVFRLKDSEVATISNSLMYSGSYDKAYHYVRDRLNSDKTVYIPFEPIIDGSDIRLTPSFVLGVLDAIKDSGRLSSFSYSDCLDDTLLNSIASVKLICDNEMALKMCSGYSFSLKGKLNKMGELK